MRAVVDNTVLSNLAIVRRPELLRELFGGEVAVPVEVRRELTAGERLRRIPVGNWSWLKEIKLTRAERTLAKQLGRTLDVGEAACLAAAFTRHLILLTDDRDARRLAQLMEVPLSGTLGLLQLSVDEGLFDLPTANSLLAEMIGKGYRSPVRTLQELEE